MESRRGTMNRLAEWGPFRAISERIRNKLLFWLLALSLIPLLILGTVTYLITADALEQSAYDALRSAQTNKAVAIRNHFEGRRSDMRALVETADALRLKGFERLLAIRELKKSLVENYFVERIRNLEVFTGMPVVASAIAAFDRSGGNIQGAAWREAEQAYGPVISNFNETYAYYDTYLVSREGRIVFSAGGAGDLGADLLNGELSQSPAAKAFRQGLEGPVFQDFEPYAPVGGDAAAFIAAPVRRDGRTLGVVLAQLSVDQIDFIMQGPVTLGTGVETYLVGPDGLFRSNSLYIGERTIINPAFQVETEGGIRQALAGESGEGVKINYLGEYVLSAWAPVRVFNQRWALVAEINLSEAFVPAGDETQGDFFTQYKEQYGYGDLGLVNPDGYLFYSVEKAEDYRTNLLTGPYADTNLGRLVRQVMDTRSFGMSPFARYAPGGNAPAAFFAQPLMAGEDVALVVVTQLSIDLIDEVMRERAGVQESGESYLMGPDGLWRSNSRFVKGGTVLDPKYRIETGAASPVEMTRREGTEEIVNFRGNRVLRSWSPLVVSPPTPADPDGIRWAVVSEVDYSAVRAPINKLAFYSLMLVLLAAGAVTVIALMLSRGLTSQVRHINDLFDEIGMGNFEARTPVVSRDELGEMAESLNAMLDNTLALIQSSEERDAMQGSIMRLLEEISGLADGDLSARAEVTEDFTGAIADSFNEMAEQLGRVVRNVKDVTLQVSATSKDVTLSTENLAETSETQAVQVSDAIAAINEMATSIQQVAESAARSAAVSEQSTGNAKDGAEAVRRTNQAMDSIREYAQETARAIKRLGESSQEVGNIVALINDIADRTSILALNASIQAAMAGEAGRGFAVVAEEVQRLAERSTNATKQIDTLIKNIQGEISEAGASMEESIQRVVEGSRLADDAHGKLQEIERVTADLGELIQSISMASRQQARASENIAKTMEEVGDVSSQTSAASRQTAVAMRNLADISDRLNKSVSVFKLAEEAPADTAPETEEGAETAP